MGYFLVITVAHIDLECMTIYEVEGQLNGVFNWTCKQIYVGLTYGGRGKESKG